MIAPDVWEDACGCPVCGREACEDHLPPEPDTAQKQTSHTKSSARALRVFTLTDLARHTFPPRRTLLARGDTPVMREGQLAQIYAERGVGKTWACHTLALVSATGGSALGFSAPEPRHVLVVDGEMASEELKERFGVLEDRLQLPATDHLVVVAADWQDEYLPHIDTVEGQAALEPFIAPADLIVFDNRSSLCDSDGEKDPTAWQPTQDYLLKLRRRGKAVLMAHHTNRLGGARGHSKAEDPLDLLIKLARPEDYSPEQGARFAVTFEKNRGLHGPAVAPFVAALTLEGWTVTSVTTHDTVEAKIRQYLTLAAAAGDSPKSANVAIQKAGVNRNKGLAIWAALLTKGHIVKQPSGGFHVA